MKVEIEIPDLEEIYYSCGEEDITPKDFKKAIVNEVPKKSEITNINKEWENYYVELIDKAIAKRFK